ncbi:YgiT-type zinc finger domain-containing protein [Methanolinea mesophila]|uniref:type II toxin-antitoxin system MqsA family antitoxin n=1 Tax=Methanolinea mesophila TaxID=547055 RepID=UPI001AE25BB9|nr:type II toxin-antitoxin system MqsA family antitoxin [Methanolinea mesophila]MBP1929880.1 YgiT-type zinc finger domain-containing protein [Methanolinea mesophila]
MKCIVCQDGETRAGATTVTLARKGHMVVIKDVPAEICEHCGEDYVDPHIIQDIVASIDKMPENDILVDVRHYVPGPATC